MTARTCFDAALSRLREEGFLTDTDLQDLCGGDEHLARSVRQRLIIQELATPHQTGVGLRLAKSRAEADAEEEEPTSTRHVFLSYGRKDAEALALRLKEALEAEGHTVWLDRSEIKAGRAWEEQIEQAIERADIVVAVLTPHAVRRPEGVCLDEISFARYHGLPIIPVMALMCTPPLGIYRLDWVDLQKWEQERSVFDSGLRKLRAALRLGGSQGVEGVYADLFGRLSPLDFGPDLARLQRDFTGRTWLEDEVRSWLAAPDGQRVFLLTGDPGAGKSAAMAHLARRLPHVAALHLCRSADAQTLDPSRFVRSLAAQLAAQIPSYASALRAVLHDPDALNVEAGSLFKNLVVNPLAAAVPDAAQTPVLVLVDGLDEALQGAADPAIPALLGSFLGEFAAYGDRVRFVLSTREVPGVLQHFGSRSRRFRIEAAAPQNRADLRAFLERMLTERALHERLTQAGTDAQTVAGWLEAKAAGNFLYGEQAVLGIRDGVFDLSDPTAFPAGLVGLYQQFFARTFPDRSTYENRVRPILDVLVAAREPLSADAVADALVAGRRAGAAGLDPLDPALTVRQRMKTLGALVPEREDGYAPYHASVAEWLSGDVKNDADTLEYAVSVRTGHGLLAETVLAAWKAKGATLPAYALRYLPVHLVAAERWDDLYELLTTLPYLEAKAGAGLVPDLARDFESAHAAYPVARPERFILRVLGRTLEYDTAFLLRHPECVFQVLWNRGWWYDAPNTAYFFTVEGAASEYTPPWLRPGPKVHELVASWRREWERSVGHRLWVRRMLPPPDLYSWPQTVLRGHEATVTGVAWSPDGARLATSDALGTVRIWPSDGQGEPIVLESTAHTTDHLTWSPEGTRLACASFLGEVCVWPTDGIATPLLYGDLNHPTGRVRNSKWSPDGKRLAIAFSESVHVWPVDVEGEPLILCRGDTPVEGLGWSPDGTRLAAGFGDGTVRVWTPYLQGEPIALRLHEAAVWQVAWSPDGTRLASVSLVDGEDQQEKKICVWPAHGEGELLVIQHGAIGAADVFGSGVAWSPDGTRLASISEELEWVGVRVCPVDRRGEPLLLQHVSRFPGVTGIAWSPDGRRLASVSREAVRIWLADGRGEPLVMHGHEGDFSCVAWSPDGTRLAIGSSDRTVRVWRVEDQDDPGEPLAPHGHDTNLRQVAWSPDGAVLAAGSEDGAIEVWSAGGQARPVALGRHEGNVPVFLAWSPDGTRVASCSGMDVRVWSALSQGEPVVFGGREAGIQVVAWSPDGTRLAGGSSNKTVHVWPVDGQGEPTVLRGHEEVVGPVAWAPDGSRLASVSLDRTVRVWSADGEGEPLVLRGHGNRIYDVAWSPDGKHLAGASFWGEIVWVWSTDGESEPLVFRGHTHLVHRLAWSPDGTRLAGASDDKSLRVWQADGKGEPTDYAGVGVLGDLFNPMMRYVVRTARGETWIERKGDGRPLAHFEADGRALDLSSHPQGKPIWAAPGSPAPSGPVVLLFQLEGLED